jgi:uncharacterized protein YggE
MKNKQTRIIVFLLHLLLIMSCGGSRQNNQSTISVSGIGTVMVQPDMVQISINFSYVAQTTKQAKEEVDKKMQQILNILKEENIEEKNIRTVSLSYDVVNEYRNGRSVRTGQRAQQTIIVNINDIVNHPAKFPALLDKIMVIDRVVVRNINFDTENKIELFKQTRKLAYQKALDKANQYAALSGLKIIKPLSISEEKNYDVLFGPALQSNVAYATAERSGPASSIPTGEQEITSEIMVTFLLE